MTAAGTGPAQLEPWELEALDIARYLAQCGVPLFVAPPRNDPKMPFQLPGAWQSTAVADPAVVDAWQPGWALCAVQGVVTDTIDIDPRNGGDVAALSGLLPRVHGKAHTPNGGQHLVIAPLGVGSKGGFLPGIDLRGGTPDGAGRGFVFLAPTRKADKQGVVRPYTWEHPPRPIPALIDTDTSGQALAELIGRPRPKLELVSSGSSVLDSFLTQRPPQSMTAAVAAIQRKTAEVAAMGPACTRDALRDLAYMLGGYVGGGFMTTEQAWEEYAGVCTRIWGATDSQDTEWFDAGMRDGPNRPFRVYDDRYTPVPQALPEPSPLVAAQYATAPQAHRLSFRDSVLDEDQLAQLPAPEPLIQNWLFRDSLAWIIGAPGSAKSLVALDMVCCISTGRPWHGNPVVQGKVLYLVLEGTAGMNARQEAWKLHNGVQRHGVRFMTARARLGNPADVAELAELIHTDGYDVIVVDTQSKASVGMEENSAKEMSLFIDNLEALQRANNACVITIHHTTRTGTNARGSSAIEGGAHTELLISKTGTEVLIHTNKQKDISDDRELTVQLIPVAGSVTTSDGGVLKQFEASTDPMSGLMDNERKVFNYLTSVGGNWSATDLWQMADVPEGSIRRVLGRLLDRGLIATDGAQRNKLYWALRLGAPVSAYSTGPTPAAGPVDNSAQPVDNSAQPVDNLPVRRDRSNDSLHRSPYDHAYDQEETPGQSAAITLRSPIDQAATTITRTPPLGGSGSVIATSGDDYSETRIETPAPGLQTPVSEVPVKAPTKAVLAKAEAKAAERQAWISELAGPDVTYPVLGTRDGRVVEISRDDAATLLLGLHTVTVDCETSGYPLGHELYELRLTQLGDDEFAVVLDPAEAAQAELITAVLDKAAVLHAHNATADLVPLAHAGLIDFDTAWAKTDDTVIQAKLNDPASTGADPGLKQLADHLLGAESASTPADEARKQLFTAMGAVAKPKVTDPPAKNGWYSVNKRSTAFARYAGSDVLDCALVAKRLPPLPDWLAARERTVAHMVSRVALKGVPLAGDTVRTLHTEHSEARTAATATIRDRYGIDNPGSPKQVAEALQARGVELPRTKASKTHPDGQLSVAAGVLETLKDSYTEGTTEGDAVRDVLTWRHHDTALKLFLEPYKVMLDHGDGRARTTIYTLGADTGRMSSTRFNFQQLPKKGGFRAVMATDPGMLQIGADFSSVEIRVAAEVSGDQVLLRMLDEGLDPHAMAAELVFGPGWTKEQRYKVKAGVFGRIYGGGLNTLATQMGVPHWIAQKLIDAIDTLWPTLAEWSRTIVRAVESGLMTTWESYSGRIIHLPRDKAYAAPNYIIQGTSRELLMDALLRWKQTPWGNCVLWPVHDEIDVHVPEADAADATAELVRCMEVTMPSGVRILAEPSEPSTCWQDAT